MSFLDRLSALIPFGKEKQELEYFFALNISNEKLTAALWAIEGKQLKILETASNKFSSLDDLSSTTDKLLDQVLGIREADVQKILFGVPSTWLLDENLKEEYLKVLRGLVKELELKPMAYVETSHALVHFLEKQESIPPTAILVGFEEHHLAVTVMRAGKLDGVKVVSRGDSSGAGIEKALLTFTNVETLPSKILIYGQDAPDLRSQLLSFPWMSKLSFLHFPKIDILADEVEIKSVCLAGASEIQSNVYYTDHGISKDVKKSTLISAEEVLDKAAEPVPDEQMSEDQKNLDSDKPEEGEALGFVVGDVATKVKEELLVEDHSLETADLEETPPEETEALVSPQETKMVEMEDFEEKPKKKFTLSKFIPRKFRNIVLLIGILGAILILLTAYLLLPKAEVKIFVEPKILEKDTQVTADPNQKTVDENAKIIPGQVVNTEISGSAKDNASGKKQIGDPAKGTVVIYNKTSDGKSFSKGTTLASSNGLKFTLDISVTMASQSAADSGITFGKANVTLTAVEVGADGNLPSGSELTVSNLPSSQVSAKAEGNFSGGTSKEVTVVSDADQKRLLASLASDLRKQAQQKLQEKLPQKKILEEALSEEIVKKSFNKNINDQAQEFFLNLTAKYKGTAFEDKDLKLIVSKLIDTQVPQDYQLNLEDTETQADVSKLEKDGKLIFLARFKAKLLPKIDTNKVRDQIKGKPVSEVVNILKGMDNVLGSEIKISPTLPPILQRLPLLSRNIKIEVGLK